MSSQMHDYVKLIIRYLSAQPTTFSGTRALNTTQFGSFPSKNCLPIVTLVTVFTIYNSTADSRTTELVTVGNMSYNKVERSMAILNVFLEFVQVFVIMIFKTTIIEMILILCVVMTQSYAALLLCIGYPQFFLILFSQLEFKFVLGYPQFYRLSF